MDAFHALSTDRQYGMAIGPIPERHIVAYAERAGLDHWNARMFTYLIRKLDVAFLDRERAKNVPKKDG